MEDASHCIDCVAYGAIFTKGGCGWCGQSDDAVLNVVIVEK